MLFAAKIVFDPFKQLKRFEPKFIFMFFDLNAAMPQCGLDPIREKTTKYTCFGTKVDMYITNTFCSFQSSVTGYALCCSIHPKFRATRVF